MPKNKLFFLLQQLEKSEIRRLKQYIRSPYFNQRTDLVRLLDYVGKCIWEEELIPKKEQIHAVVYGKDKEFSDHQLRLIKSLLYKQLENFLIVEGQAKDTSSQQQVLTTFYKKRKINKYFESQYNSTQKVIDKNPLSDEKALKDQLEQERLWLEYQSRQERSGELNIQKVSDQMDLLFMAQKLRHACLATSHETVFKIKYDLQFLSQIIDAITNKPVMQGVPSIAIYYYGYLLQTDGDKDVFQNYKKTITKYSHFFEIKEQYAQYLLAINFCTKEAHKGHQIYVEEAFKLYKEAVEKEILIQEGALSRYTFRNIVSYAVSSEKWNWAKQFIEKYNILLPKLHQKSYYNHSMARLAYETKKYDDVMKYLQQTEYRDVLLSLSAKALLLKIYVELAELDALDAHMNAMKNYIYRKKVIGYHKTMYLNLISISKKMMRTISENTRKKLAAEVEKLEYIAERKWLLEQLR